MLFAPYSRRQNQKRLDFPRILMSSRQYDFTFFMFLFFTKNAAVPSVYDEENTNFHVFPIFFIRVLDCQSI